MSQPSQANQPSLFENIPEKIHWLKDEIAFSLSFDQNKILKDIIRLYLGGQAIHADVTYSRGIFYKHIPQPRLKFDINPQAPDVVKSSFDNLPLENDSIDSLVFDPPFMPTKSRNNPGVIKTRFTAFNSVVEMFAAYKAALQEFWRVLKPGGILIVKCQDTISSGKNHWSHFEIERYSREIGFDEIDLFILGNKRPLISSKWRTQRHARKSHSYFIVCQKPKIKRGKNG